jgi:electron transport complex protein RnfD
MTTWISPITDAVSSATPLALLKEGGVGLRNLPPLWDMFAGNIGGSLGETSALALLIGGGYLLFRKVISPAIPFSYLGTMAIFAWIFGGEILFSGEYIYHLLAGGLMIGAFFMATDYTTSPTTFKGRIIFGVGCGLLTGIIRIYGGYPGGVSFAILLMNLTVPLIERGTIPKSFGGAKKHA